LDDDVLTGNIKEIPREGTLLPDTYNFTRGVTREQIIQRMQQAQQRVLKEIWERHAPDLPIKTPDQLVILASLVEKETGKPEERTRVAAVFVNRLKQKMRLQSDPTIIYGLVGGKGTLGRPIMKSEIDQPTPYNTYQIDGLPPGPIANPGRASLEAAANPARTRELYFVADGTGGHAFAETYEQHQKNVARLRDLETDQKDQVLLTHSRLRRPRRPWRFRLLRRRSRAARRHRRNQNHADDALARHRPCDSGKPPLSSARIFSQFSQWGSHSMALSSMTGFARGHGVSGSYAWAWEVKSVNGKGLDLRLRFPPGWDAIEVAVRAQAAERLARGSIQANLTVERSGAVPVVRINAAVLDAVLTTLKQLAPRIEASPPSLDGLLALKGVMEVGDQRSARRNGAARRRQ
jgi:hypothetical protein